SLVAAGTPAFVLADTSSVSVRFGAPDTMLPNLKVGLALTVTSEAITGAEFHGRITSISPAADARSRVFDVEIAVPNPRNQLKSGMIAALEVPGEPIRQPVTVVPLTAIVRSKDDPNG